MPHSASDRTPVTVLGLGLMGQALAGAFLTDGHPTTVWNRSAAKAESLVDRGAALAASARDAITASELVVVCVTDYPAVRELLDPLADALAGRVLVNLTSGTSKQARATAEWAARHGITYVDGVISAAPPAIGAPDTILIYSGQKAAFDAHESTLRSLGGATSHVGADPGMASLHEMAMLTFMWSVLNGFLHAAALLETAQVDSTAVAPFLVDGVGMLTGWLPGMAEQIAAGKFPADDATIDIHVAAMAHLLEESAALGVNAELPALIKSLGDRAVAEGRGGESYAAMIEQFRKPAAARA